VVERANEGDAQPIRTDIGLLRGRWRGQGEGYQGNQEWE
jgi:hypothetical protein